MAKAKKLPSGSWRVRVYDGKTAEGKNIYKSFTAPVKKQDMTNDFINRGDTVLALLREIDSRNKLLFMDTAYYRK